MNSASSTASPAKVERKARASLNYLVATLLDCWAMSLSITALQPALRLVRCLTMQAVMAGMFGISEAQRRNASPVHICWASALKAKLDVDDRAETETANASIKPAWRMVLVRDAVIFGSSVVRRSRRVADAHLCLRRPLPAVVTL